MERFEFLPCLFRGTNGQIQEVPYPKAEPRRENVTLDLYAASYGVTKGLFGPARLKDLEITIFNTRSYRPDPELEREATDRLLAAIVRQEGPEIVQASGGVDSLRRQVAIDTWWEDR